jgi:hypothetical protein
VGAALLQDGHLACASAAGKEIMAINTDVRSQLVKTLFSSFNMEAHVQSRSAKGDPWSLSIWVSMALFGQEKI